MEIRKFSFGTTDGTVVLLDNGLDRLIYEALANGNALPDNYDISLVEENEIIVTDGNTNSVYQVNIEKL